MALDRAEAIAKVSGVIIESAKVEVKFLEAIDAGDASEFFDMQRVEKRGSLAVEPMQRRLAR